jgi:hypothetical protein
MVSGIHERGAQLPSPKWCINYLDASSQTFRQQLGLGFLQMYPSMRNLVIPSVEIPPLVLMLLGTHRARRSQNDYKRRIQRPVLSTLPKLKSVYEP